MPGGITAPGEPSEGSISRQACQSRVSTNIGITWGHETYGPTKYFPSRFKTGQCLPRPDSGIYEHCRYWAVEMKSLTIASMLLPLESLLLPLLVLAGLFLIVGMRKLGLSLITLVLFVAFSPILEGIVEAVLDSLPVWVSWLMLAAFVFILLGIGIELLIGRRAVDHVKGELALSVLKWTVLLPFRLTGMIFRLLFGRRQG